MVKNISFYIKLLLLILLFVDNSNAVELSIIPLKKPILDKITKQSKLTQGIIRPKSKPVKKVEKQKTSNEILSPKSKPSKKIKKTITKTVEKKIQKNNSIIPRNKPLKIKKSSTVKKTRSKFYSQKDFDIAKKSVKAVDKRQWTSALSLSKKAKDKSIYNYIQ